MKISKLALAAIALWLVTMTVIAWFFVHGNVTSGTDDRTAIVLQPSERTMILREMRGMLSATQGILEGINQGDMALVAKSSRAAGMALSVDVNPVLMAKLPMPFKSMGMSVHHQMDALAQAAETGTPTPELLKRLSTMLTYCVGCHSAWQFKAGD